MCPQPTVWPLAPHTGAKHAILRAYLNAWFPILGSWNGRVIFIDGFAGPGEYSEGEPGSPLIALDAIADHRHDLSNCEFVLRFIERDAARARHLKRLLDSRESAGDIPDHVNWDVAHGEFSDVIGHALDSLGDNSLAPAFVMLDPFGPAGVPYDLVTRLARHPRTELLISFMYESIARWLSQPAFEAHLDALYGCQEWRSAASMPAAEKRQFLHDLYRERLELAGMEIVRSFQMLDEGGRTEYFLFFGTHHPKGWSSMKDAMWKVDPISGYLFSDATNPDQLTLFQPEPDYEQLRNFVQGRFAGSVAEIDEVEEFVLMETAFRVPHLRKNVLIPMEDDETIEVLTERSRRKTYPAGTVIRFAEI